MTLRYDPPTKRAAMSKPRIARIFVANDGKCAICGNPIRIGEDFDIEHPDPLWAGGSDNDLDLTIVHERCHAPKTAAEATQRAKRNKVIASGYVGFRKPKSQFKKKLPSRSHPFGETVRR